MENNSYKSKREIIKCLNKVLVEAIYHGGDGGGAYFTNEDALLKSLKELLECLNLTDVCKIYEDENNFMPQLKEILAKEKNISRNSKNIR